MSAGKNIELILLLFIAAIAGSFGGYFAARYAAPATPPIVVIDIQEYVDRAILGQNGQLNPEKVEEGIRMAEEAAQVIADKGFLVLQKQAVVAAPEGYFFTEQAEPAESK